MARTNANAEVTDMGIPAAGECEMDEALRARRGEGSW
jgi:hypothetical protein